MNAFWSFLSVLVGALGKLWEAKEKSSSDEELAEAAKRIAAETAYLLTSQQAHLARAEQTVPGFKR